MPINYGRFHGILRFHILDKNTRITQCDLFDRFFCIHARSPKNDLNYPLCKQSIGDLSHLLFHCLKKTKTRTRLHDTLNGCKTRTIKKGYLDVKQRIIANVDFEDPQLTQRVGKILFDLYKE